MSGNNPANRRAIAALKTQLTVLHAKRYKLQRLIPEKDADGNPNPLYKGRQPHGAPLMLRADQILARRNEFYNGQMTFKHNVFIRPDNPYYIMIDLDGVSRGVLQRAKTYKPCLIMNTSFGHYHVWYDVSYLPTPQHASAVQRWLTDDLLGDTGANGLKQVAALAMFRNMKPGREDFQGRPYQIEIEYFKKGQRAEVPDEAEELEPSRQAKRRRMGRRSNNGVDNSKVDWNATLMHLRAGYSRSECIRLVEENSEKRHYYSNMARYAENTVDNAIAKLRSWGEL